MNGSMTDAKNTQKKFAETFFGNLDKLSSGERAALKRSGGKPYSQAKAQAMAAFGSCMPCLLSLADEYRWFAAACWYCQWSAEDSAGDGCVPFAKALRELKLKLDSNTIDTRLKSLLDEEWDEDSLLNLKLFRLIKMMKAQGIKPDITALAEDLRWWNSYTKNVQRRWTREYFCYTEKTEEKQEEN